MSRWCNVGVHDREIMVKELLRYRPTTIDLRQSTVELYQIIYQDVPI